MQRTLARAARAAPTIAAAILAGCAATNISAPRTPIHLPRVVAETPLARAQVAHDPAATHWATSHGEVALAETAFHPHLGHVLDAYLSRELGEKREQRPLSVARLTVKLKMIPGAGDTAAGVAAGMRSVPPTPGAPAGAGLVGGLIAAAILEGARAASDRVLVLASVEGTLGELEFAGFGYGPYKPEASHESIEEAVAAAFATAADSLRARLTLSPAPISPETKEAKK